MAKTLLVGGPTTPEPLSTAITPTQWNRCLEIQHSTVSGTTNYGPELLLPYSLTGDNYAKFNIPTNDLIAAYRAQNDTVRLNASIYFSLPEDTIAIPPPYTDKTPRRVPYSPINGNRPMAITALTTRSSSVWPISSS